MLANQNKYQPFSQIVAIERARSHKKINQSKLIGQSNNLTSSPPQPHANWPLKNNRPTKTKSPLLSNHRDQVSLVLTADWPIKKQSTHENNITSSRKQLKQTAKPTTPPLIGQSKTTSQSQQSHLFSRIVAIEGRLSSSRSHLSPRATIALLLLLLLLMPPPVSLPSRNLPIQRPNKRLKLQKNTIRRDDTADVRGGSEATTKNSTGASSDQEPAD